MLWEATVLTYDETEETITLHGLGFLQVKLQGKQRLHVWHPDLPRRRCFEVSNVHDHRFGFTSRVLVGTQINRVYAHKVVGTFDGRPMANAEATSDPATHISYLHEGERTKYGNRPWLPDQLLSLVQTYEETVKAGNTYEMRPYVYHSTHPGGDGRVATIMQKMFEGHKGAHSLVAVGHDPDVDFDRKQWSQERLWSIVLDVLSQSNGMSVLTPGIKEAV